MKIYIVNLLSEEKRKKYIKKLLADNKLFEQIFIEAVDGRLMPEEEINSAFDYKKSFEEYGRKLRNGEVGCTLSHYKIYKQMEYSNDKYVIVIEDDIEFVSDINYELLTDLKSYYDTNIPTVILLSGKYEYCKTKKINNKYKIASVFHAWGTYGYLINYSAAKIISNEKPFWLADDWWYFKTKGIRIFGIKPHFIDPLPVGVVPSQIQIGNKSANAFVRKNMSVKKMIKSYYRFGMRRIFRFFGLYENEYVNNR